MAFAPDRRSFLNVAVGLFAPPIGIEPQGGSWQFYHSGTDQIALVYGSSDLAAPLGSRIEVGGNGRVPQIYLDPAIAYRATFTNMSGQMLATLDPVPAAPSSGAAPGSRHGVEAGEAIRVTDLGAIGDGRLHSLSERFSSLAEAQAVFPSAIDMSDSLDGVAIQSAIDLAAGRGLRLQTGGRVIVPAGRYPLTRSLMLPNKIVLEGEGPDITIIDNQNNSLAAPLIVNKNPETASMTLRSLSLHGGTHGVRITVSGYVDGLTMDRVSFQLQSDKNFECNKLLQIATFRNCSFGLAPFGVYVAAWTSNVVTFDQCSFENHSRTHLHLRGAECVNVHGGRFEGGGTMGTAQATLDFEGVAAVDFAGVYFENTHQLLLRENKSRNGVGFRRCHFTGTTGPTGIVAYRFESDGIVAFDANDWGLRTEAPAKAALNGINLGLVTDGRVYLLRSRTHHHFMSERVVAQAASRDLLVVRRVGSPSAVAMTLSGTLTLHVHRIASDGMPHGAIYRYDIVASATRAVALRLATQTPNAPVLAVRPDSGAGLVAVSGTFARGAQDDVFELRWTFEGTSSGSTQDTYLDVDID